MYSIMEKKVYKIAKWFVVEKEPAFVAVLPRRNRDDELDAKETFFAEANKLLFSGCKITYVVHSCNYRFVTPEGRTFNLYMYED